MEEARESNEEVVQIVTCLQVVQVQSLTLQILWQTLVAVVLTPPLVIITKFWQ